jgi:hypothetical protein
MIIRSVARSAKSNQDAGNVASVGVNEERKFQEKKYRHTRGNQSSTSRSASEFKIGVLNVWAALMQEQYIIPRRNKWKNHIRGSSTCLQVQNIPKHPDMSQGLVSEIKEWGAHCQNRSLNDIQSHSTSSNVNGARLTSCCCTSRPDQHKFERASNALRRLPCARIIESQERYLIKNWEDAAIERHKDERSALRGRGT